MEESGLLEVILPEFKKMEACQQPPQFHPEGDCRIHTLLTLEKMNQPPPELAWAALLHDIGKPDTFSQLPGDRIRFNGHESVGAEISENILRRFKAPAKFIQSVSTLVRDHLRLNHIKEMRPATWKRLLRRDDFDLLLELNRLDCLASHQDLELYNFARIKIEQLKAEDNLQSLKPELLLNGQDLIGLGYQPGPLFKQILEKIEDWQLEGQVTNKNQAVAEVKKNWPLV
jgi:poly(A) polymerase